MSELEEGGRQTTIIPHLPEAEIRAARATGTSSAAYREFEQLSSTKSPEQLAQEADAAEHGRNQRFKNHFELIAVFALWCSAGAIAIICGVWIYHLIMPDKWKWLSTEGMSHIQSIATAGLLVGVIGNHFKKRLGA